MTANNNARGEESFSIKYKNNAERKNRSEGETMASSMYLNGATKVPPRFSHLNPRFIDKR
jgi:hypothetical protein